jgi:hypothetical protein
MTYTFHGDRLRRNWTFVHVQPPSVILPFSAQKKESQVWLSFDFPSALGSKTRRERVAD